MRAQAAWQTIIGWIDKAIRSVKEFFGMGGGQAAAAPVRRGRLCARRLHRRPRHRHLGQQPGLGLARRTHHAGAGGAPARRAGFLEALRRSGGNLRRVLDGMGRFALGGMVGAPAFAAAAAVGGMSNVTIQFPGLPPIGGLRASSDVVDELRKAAALAQVRSGGRKPSRYS